MTVRRFLFLLALAAFLLPGVPGRAGGTTVDVVVVSGPMEGRMVDFVRESIEESPASLVVIQLDVPAVLSADALDLVDLVADPPVPVAVWVGPEPASAHGAAAVMAAVAPIRGAAPGVMIGWADPLVAGSSRDPDAVAGLAPDLPGDLYEGRVEVGGTPIEGLLDVIQPSIGQFIVSLDGTVVDVRGEPVTLETATVQVEDGVEVVSPTAVRFLEPGLIDRTLRLAVSPEAAFFFLVVGLSLAAFEFYAAGPGVAAGVAAISLLIAGYGMAVLPMWWPGVGAALAGLVLYVIEFQRNDLGWKSLLGTAALVFGGLRFVDASPQIVPTWWVVALIVVMGALFFGFGLTTMVRARFSTQTIGREHLVGRTGTASGAIAPEGVVVVDGAEWRARAARSSGIGEGDTVRVTAVSGIVLDVEPIED